MHTAIRAAHSGFPQQNASAVVLGLAPVQRFTIADGDRGTAQTIAKIRKLVHQGMTDQLVNRVAIGIVRGVPQFDFAGEVKAVYSWVLANIRFVRDVFNVETLRTAREVLTVQAGDCDDINAVLLPSLLLTIGANVRLITISANPEDPETFSHIYCEVEMPDGGWLPLDCARRDPAFGRGPRYYFRKRAWSLTDSAYRDLRGLGSYFRDFRRLGDFSDIAGSVAQLISAGGTAAANIIRSTTAPQFVPQGYTTNPFTGQVVPLNPAGSVALTSAPGGVLASGSGSIPNWMIYAALGVGALILLKK